MFRHSDSHSAHKPEPCASVCLKRHIWVNHGWSLVRHNKQMANFSSELFSTPSTQTWLRLITTREVDQLVWKPTETVAWSSRTKSCILTWQLWLLTLKAAGYLEREIRDFSPTKQPAREMVMPSLTTSLCRKTWNGSSMWVWGCQPRLSVNLMVVLWVEWLGSCMELQMGILFSTQKHVS